MTSKYRTAWLDNFSISKPYPEDISGQDSQSGKVMKLWHFGTEWQVGGRESRSVSLKCFVLGNDSIPFKAYPLISLFIFTHIYLHKHHPYFSYLYTHIITSNYNPMFLGLFSHFTFTLSIISILRGELSQTQGSSFQIFRSKVYTFCFPEPQTPSYYLELKN